MLYLVPRVSHLTFIGRRVDDVERLQRRTKCLAFIDIERQPQLSPPPFNGSHPQYAERTEPTVRLEKYANQIDHRIRGASKVRFRLLPGTAII